MQEDFYLCQKKKKSPQNQKNKTKPPKTRKTATTTKPQHKLSTAHIPLFSSTLVSIRTESDTASVCTRGREFHCLHGHNYRHMLVLHSALWPTEATGLSLARYLA